VTGAATSPPWPALRQIRPAGDFEAVTTFAALGVADLDLPGATLHPNIGNSCAGGMDNVPATSVKTVLWTFTHANDPGSAVISYCGPRTIAVGLPNLRSITVSWLNPGEIHVVANTGVKHGYRMFVVPGAGMNRVVVDIAH
jgi:hypothetical protein